METTEIVPDKLTLLPAFAEEVSFGCHWRRLSYYQGAGGIIGVCCTRLQGAAGWHTCAADWLLGVCHCEKEGFGGDGREYIGAAS